MLFNSTSSSSNSVGAMTLKGSSISERLSLSSAELSSDMKCLCLRWLSYLHVMGFSHLILRV